MLETQNQMLQEKLREFEESHEEVLSDFDMEMFILSLSSNEASILSLKMLGYDSSEIMKIIGVKNRRAYWWMCFKLRKKYLRTKDS
jgi:hypothetical protein